jgi:hypothetical protein
MTTTTSMNLARLRQVVRTVAELDEAVARLESRVNELEAIGTPTAPLTLVTPTGDDDA